jgi:hypothetical protein
MKITTLKSMLLMMALLMLVSQAFSEDLVGTRIDVQGARFSDQMWLFSVATCTNDFDNGWDGFKMFGSPLAPQLFAIEPDGDYQVDAIPDFNNTFLGFSAGIDSVYTFTFTNENLAKDYQQLYLIDSVANKTVDIYQSGTKYTFTASITTAPVKRFKIVTSNPTVLNDSTNTTSSVTTVLNLPNSGGKNLRIYYSDKNIYIENAIAQKGRLVLCSAETGRVIKTVNFNSDDRAIINTDAPRGVYVVNCITQSDNVSSKIIIN